MNLSTIKSKFPERYRILKYAYNTNILVHSTFSVEMKGTIQRWQRNCYMELIEVINNIISSKSSRN